MDTTHTVKIQRQNRGIGFLIGSVVIFLLIRWTLSGQILSLSRSLPCNSCDGFSSVTGAVLPIVIDLVVFTGITAIAISRGIWAVVWDLISGVVSTSRELAGTRRAESAAARSAIESAATSAGGNAGGQAAESAKSSIPKMTTSQAVKNLNSRVKRLEAEVFPPPESEIEPDSTLITDRLKEKIERLEQEIESLKSSQASPQKPIAGESITIEPVKQEGIS